MYTKGEVKILWRQPTDEDYASNDVERWQSVYDARSEKTEPPVVYLPHSCDEWVVGGETEVETLIRDLTTCLADLRAVSRVGIRKRVALREMCFMADQQEVRGDDLGPRCWATHQCPEKGCQQTWLCASPLQCCPFMNGAEGDDLLCETCWAEVLQEEEWREREKMWE